MYNIQDIKQLLLCHFKATVQSVKMGVLQSYVCCFESLNEFTTLQSGTKGQCSRSGWPNGQ